MMIDEQKKKFVRFFRKDLAYETVLIDFHSNARMRYYRNKTVVQVCSVPSTCTSHIILLCRIIIVAYLYSSQSIENARRFGRISQLETTHTHVVDII
jgi:hypothetical protein